jgi:polyhydroxyalkanoate synthesis regulator phasin
MENVAETSKKLMETWAETQKQMVENWTKTTNKFQEAAKNGDILNKGAELYKEWYQAQKDLFSQAVEKTNGEMSSYMPEYMKEMMKQQNEFTTKWFETMNSMANQAMQQPKFSNPFAPDAQKHMMDNMFSMYRDWASKMNEGVMGMSNKWAMPASMQETFKNMMNSTKVYQTVYDVWQPYFKMLTENKFDANEYFKLVDMTKFNELTQSMTNMFSPEKMKEAFAQTNKYVESFRETFLKEHPLKDFFKMPEFGTFGMNNDFAMMSDFQQNIVERLQKLYDPFAKIIPPSREKEMAELAAGIQQSLTKFQSKTLEMNSMIAQEAYKTAESHIKAAFEKAQQGQAPLTFNEFFLHWVDLLEARLIELFNTSEFSHVQSDVLSLQMDIKSAMRKIMEGMLVSYPVALTTDIDELSKQVHDLKAKVKALEKQLSKDVVIADATPVIETSEPAKKTSSRKTSTK